MRPLPVLLLAVGALAGASARAESPKSPLLPAPRAAAPAPAKPTPADAKAFVEEANGDLKRLWIRSSTAEWIKSTYITDDTERNAAALNEDVMAYLSSAIRESVKFDGVRADPDTERMLYLLRIASSLPAPSDAAKRGELAQLAARLEGIYGKGKWCGPVGRSAKSAERCRDLQDLEEILAKSRQYQTLLDAWTGWHTISREMRPLYQRLVSLSNEGAREIGFQDLGQLWRAGYDMAPDAFEADTDRLWQQVKPFYDELHCYVRAQLQRLYGKDRVPDGKPIPAHLLGNMWAQSWGYVNELVEPYPGQPSLDVTPALVAHGYDAVRMVKTAEAFFVSLGLDPLPPTFWARSLLVKPEGREVVCHASAWDPAYADDLRIKMCVRINHEDLVVIHHELGHDYYFHAYHTLPVLFQQGANDGFHEAIGDTLALSVTPRYLQGLGLLDQVGVGDQALIDELLYTALDKVAFLPFAIVIDKWRWEVFAGKVGPADWTARWWELRRAYQGVAPPVARVAADFDPGAKYHVPANTPYLRYFLATILQFQFHRALCRAAGQDGPLYACSIHGSKEAGRRLQAMLALGASRPWPDALEALTGERRLDAGAMLDYFAPLVAWLEKENQGQQCGW